VPTATPTPVPTEAPIATPTPGIAINKTTFGEILGEETWRDEMTIVGDVWIAEGASLTIEPGTVVRFTAQSDVLQRGGFEDAAEPERVNFPDDPPAINANMVQIEVFGTLKAQGTADNPIIFTSDSAIPFVNDWAGIAVHDATVVVEHAVVEYNYWGIGLYGDEPLATITNTVFRHIAACGICTGDHPIVTQVVISENEFHDCRHEGVSTFPEQNIVVRNNLFTDNYAGVIADGNSILIEGNTIRNNEQGIGAQNGASPTILGNEITDNTVAGIWVWYESSATVHGNNIYNNGMNLKLGNSPGNLNAGDNWWGTTNEFQIGQGIFDKRDRPWLGYVEYRPYATEPFVIDGSE
jgi:parallel beta-helix repeat protein